MTASLQQLAIITAPPDARALILAGPGTGKTEVVARRLANFITSDQPLVPGNILILSFSRAAVRVLGERVRKVLAENPDLLDDLKHLSIRTFDSWTFRMLRRFGHQAADILRQGYDASIDQLVQELHSRSREELLVDTELELHRIRHIIVDECQDLTGPRAELVRALLEKLCPVDAPDDRPVCGFTILGDLNQAIYDWVEDKAGRRSQCSLTSHRLLTLLKLGYGMTLTQTKLDRNHRSTNTVVTLLNEATQLVEEAGDRPAESEAGFDALLKRDPLVLTQEQLFEVLRDLQPEEKCGILCRDNGQALGIATSLSLLQPADGTQLHRWVVDAGDPPPIIPYWVAGILARYERDDITLRLFERLFSDAAAAHLQLREGASARTCWRMLMRAAGKGENETSMRLDRLRDRLGWLDAFPDDETVMLPEITVTTVHQSKGREFDRVVLYGLDQRKTHPDYSPVDEARVCYVGLSRARRDLHVLPSGQSSFRRKSLGDIDRWHSYNRTSYWHHLELGCAGDIDPFSFVDPGAAALGSADNVEKAQTYLRQHALELLGCPVFLRKSAPDGQHVVYLIIAQPDGGEEIILGCTSDRLTLTLNQLNGKNSYFLKLPPAILGLRISGVTTIVGAQIGAENRHIEMPYRKSLLWLGVTIHGIGHFKFKNKTEGQAKK